MVLKLPDPPVGYRLRVKRAICAVFARANQPASSSVRPISAPSVLISSRDPPAPVSQSEGTGRRLGMHQESGGGGGGGTVQP